MHRISAIVSLLLLVPLAWAKPKLPKVVDPLPDVEQMLTQAGWTMTPEMAALYSRPGDILSESNVLQISGPNCFEAEVEEGAFATMEVTRSMSAGVRARVKVVNVRGGVALEKKIIFDTPVTRRIAELSLVPTSECADKLRAAQARGKDLSGWYVITESLSAVIQQQQCGSYDAEAGTFLVSADASVQQACAQTSLEPVAVAFKTMRVLSLMPDVGPKPEVRLGTEARDYEQIVAAARADGGIQPSLNPEEASVEAGQSEDYAALVARALASKKERERIEAAAAEERRRLAAEQARLERAKQAELQRVATVEAELQRQLQVAHERRLKIARADLLAQASADLQALVPLMDRYMSVGTKNAMQAYIDQYRYAEITVGDTKEHVDISGVDEVRQALARQARREAEARKDEEALEVEAEKAVLLMQAEQDFAAIQPLLFMPLTQETRPVLQAFVDQYASVRIRQREVVQQVRVPGVQRVQIKLGIDPSASDETVEDRASNERGVVTGWHGEAEMVEPVRSSRLKNRGNPSGWRKSEGQLPLGAAAQASGGLTMASVDRVVQRHMDQIQYCYQIAAPTVAGEAFFFFVIQPDGSVRSSRTVKSTLGLPAVEQCINERLMKFRFPASTDGRSFNVRYPFKFCLSHTPGC